MKVEPKEFKEPTNNTWKLIEASEPLEISQQHADMVSQARQVLQQVVTEHPKTPFSFVAQRELDRGFGWKWIESHSDGPALTSRKRSELEWKYRWGGRSEFLGRPKLVPRRKPPRL
ncbi:MAG: hypothetical protein O2983_07150 [Planctomycetota bacterium]|nr:hypothetical protein [Planctomycetota bacterium]